MAPSAAQKKAQSIASAATKAKNDKRKRSDDDDDEDRLLPPYLDPQPPMRIPCCVRCLKRFSSIKSRKAIDALALLPPDNSMDSSHELYTVLANWDCGWRGLYRKCEYCNRGGHVCEKLSAGWRRSANVLMLAYEMWRRTRTNGDAVRVLNYTGSWDRAYTAWNNSQGSGSEAQAIHNHHINLLRYQIGLGPVMNVEPSNHIIDKAIEEYIASRMLVSAGEYESFYTGNRVPYDSEYKDWEWLQAQDLVGDDDDDDGNSDRQ